MQISEENGLVPLIVKPSDTRWLSRERCVWPIYREHPALIVTLQQLYETSGDAEAYCIGALLATYTVVASVMFLSEVLDIQARMNVSMQRKLLDLSRLPVLLKITTDQLEHLKDKRSEWLGSVKSEISLLKEKHDITLGTHCMKPLVFYQNHSRVSNSSCNSIRQFPSSKY